MSSDVEEDGERCAGDCLCSSPGEEDVFLRTPKPHPHRLQVASERIRRHVRRLDWTRRSVTSPLCTSPGVRKLHITDLNITRRLGSGGFGSVYEGVVDFTRVAVKRMHRSSKNRSAKVESFRAEHRALRLVHPNLVRTLAVSSLAEVDVDALIVMEYVGQRNLQVVCDSRRFPLNMRKKIKYGLQIARALEYIHGNSIVHLDLKPANVMVTLDDVCKVGDFGCCQELQFGIGNCSPTQRSSLTGTFAYRAPELLKGLAPNAKADVYSFGITLWQMWSRESPFVGENPHVVVFGVVAYNLRPSLKMSMDDSDPVENCYKELFTEAWDSDVTQRPSASEIVTVLNTWLKYL